MNLQEIKDRWNRHPGDTGPLDIYVVNGNDEYSPEVIIDNASGEITVSDLEKAPVDITWLLAVVAEQDAVITRLTNELTWRK